jgi:hypothetical protein
VAITRAYPELDNMAILSSIMMMNSIHPYFRVSSWTSARPIMLGFVDRKFSAPNKEFLESLLFLDYFPGHL